MGGWERGGGGVGVGMYRVRRMLPLHSSKRLAVASWSADWERVRLRGAQDAETIDRLTSLSLSPSPSPSPCDLPVTQCVSSLVPRQAARATDPQWNPLPHSGRARASSGRQRRRSRPPLEPRPSSACLHPVASTDPLTAPVAPLSRLPSAPACCSLALVHLHDRSRSRHCWVRISSLFVPSGQC